MLLALRDSYGYDVVGEAATDVIVEAQAAGVEEPWRATGFTEAIVALQLEREMSSYDGPVRLFDRSPVCTLALARYLGHPVGPRLAAEIARVVESGVYERQVFLLRPLGFITPTDARRISYEESLVFERGHEKTYGELGFELVDVLPVDVASRVVQIDEAIRAWA